MRTINVNGDYIGNARSVVVKNGEVYIDGKLINRGEDSVPITTLKIRGQVGSIESDVDVNVDGDVGTIDGAQDVNCGNVAGNVVASGDVNCGNIKGNAQVSGDVNCGRIGGDLVGRSKF